MTEPGHDRQQEILRERAVGLARIAAPAAPASPIEERCIEVLEFKSAGERYAFETVYVAQVFPICAITPIPGVPNFVVGIIPSEGDVLSVIDLRSLLDLPLSRLIEPTSIIVLRNQTMEFGILAEEILGIERFPLESIEHELPALSNTVDTYLKGVSSTRTAILNADQLLSDSRLIVEIS
ncbi:MAG: hypothetical protein A3I66_14320 [Burkholderiales bacterium RIFCSPLOWO2_02_FULL_57_36]|nr:MAG: hypothetical protein A3I66_14320 [Burkholderiales bacterium RIFCSPLOWO2_02_FULL_57_36]